MLRRLPWRTFVAAFILTLCVLSLGCAFFVIECRIQQTTYGQVDLGVTYALEDGLPTICVDGEEIFSAPSAAAPIADIAVPPPLRLLATVWQWETEAAQRLWETLA